MKVLHVPYVFAPDPMGGTEVYVASLAREQAARGIRPEIAAPAAGNAEYEIDGLPVHRFGSTAQPSLRALYREGDPLAAENFARILDRVGPDLVHFHALSTAISVLTMRAAKRRGQPVVFTYHTPTVSCMRGTLLEWGRTTCDGTVSVSRCAPCALHSRGVPAPLSRLAGALPAGFGRTLGHLNLAGGAWTALRATELSGLYADGFREFLSHPDAIVVPCLWSAEVLRRNGIPDERLTLSRQGFAKPPAPAARVARRREPGKPIRLVFLGRLDPTKGVDLLLEATRRAPEGLVELDVYGVVQHDGASTGRYLERL
ncbi:MAG TPA: glycosyl transferase group 1, partial [Solibacterales bacterium]|nr:glycosyl transferase group 1 [Bryobacterales bacterium]